MILTATPAGIRVSIRVDLARIYFIIVTDSILNKYKFIVDEVNDISLAVFFPLQGDALAVQLSGIETSKLAFSKSKIKFSYCPYQ